MRSFGSLEAARAAAQKGANLEGDEAWVERRTSLGWEHVEIVTPERSGS